MKSDRDKGRTATIARRAARAAVLEAGLALAALFGGCVHAPRHAGAPPVATSSPAPSPAPSNATPTVSVDLSRTAGENTTFHETATERQKFQVHVNFGKVFESQGDLDRALQEYRDALKVAEDRGHNELTSADEALAHRRIASALDRLGQFAQSESHYQKARKLAPKDARIWNDAGYSYYLQGRWADAEKSLRTALTLAPDDARARTNLGMTLAAAGKTAEALSLLERQPGRRDRPRESRLPARLDRPVPAGTARVPGRPLDAAGPGPGPPRPGSARTPGKGPGIAAGRIAREEYENTRGFQSGRSAGDPDVGDDLPRDHPAAIAPASPARAVTAPTSPSRAVNGDSPLKSPGGRVRSRPGARQLNRARSAQR